MDKKIEDLQKKIKALEKEIQKEKKKPKERVVEVTKMVEKYEPMKVLYRWTAPQRVFFKRDKPWFLKVTFIALILILFAAILQDFMIILIICVFVLIIFLLASIPPNDVEHQITNKGVKSIGTLYKVKELREFWVAEKFGQKIVHVKTNLTIPSRLVMLISRKDEMTVIEHLSRFMDYRTPPEKQGWVSRMSDGVYIHPKKYAKIFGIKTKKRKSPKKKSKKK